jgi:hypothetical protein
MNLKNQYCHFLLKTHVNYTCTNMSEHTDLSHDKITRFLASNPMSEHHFYEQVHIDSDLPSGGYIIFDDTVIDKSHSHQIEMVRRQYSGNAGGVIKGIGIVNMLYYVPKLERWYLLSYRIFDPDIDNKSKIDHVTDLLQESEQNCIAYVGVLMDTWYAVSSLFQLVNAYGKYFYCPIKSNRLVQVHANSIYLPMGELIWDKKQLQNGRAIKVKNLNMSVKVFKIAVSTNRIDYVLTNDLSDKTTEQIILIQKMRWHIECLHRELKQLTGIEKCQCRKALSQRTHIFCAMLVWNKIKEIAYDTFLSAYQVKAEPLRKYLLNELLMPCPIFA